MRTVVLLGMLYIGDAIGPPDYKNGIPGIIVIVLFSAIAMDIIDFLR